MMQPNYTLTSHKPGSMREVFAISWPLILGLFSGYFMVFVDRLFLGRYSLDALTASTMSGTAAYAFFLTPMIIAGVTEVFVGRHHGAGSLDKMSRPVWQMLIFSAALFPLFWIAAYALPGLFFHNSPNEGMQTLYFKILVVGGPLFCMAPALTGYFCGQGKTKIIAVATVLSNGLNVILDYAFIFGMGPIPSMGIKGAAIATVISMAFMVLFLGIFFLLCRYNSLKALRVDIREFWEGIKIGGPKGIAHSNEIFSHFVLFKLVEVMGTQSLVILALTQSLIILLSFIGEGLSKGNTAIASNFIGAKQFSLISKNLFSSLKLQIFFAAAVGLFLWIGSPGIFQPFFHGEDMQMFNDPTFNRQLTYFALGMGLFFLFDGWSWAMSGTLTACGDTKFIMLVSFLSYWVLAVVPTYIGVTFFDMSVNGLLVIILSSAASVVILYYLRLRQEPWQALEQKIELEPTSSFQ